VALNLDPVREMVERDFLDDLVEVREPKALPVGNLTSTLNPTTLALTPPPTPAAFWSGTGAVIDLGSLGQGRTPMTADQDVPAPDDATHKALLPLDAPLFEVDQVLRVVGSRLAAGPRDPAIVGQEFRFVKIPGVSTYSVVRIAFLARL
jgi:hypothetical protein